MRNEYAKWFDEKAEKQREWQKEHRHETFDYLQVPVRISAGFVVSTDREAKKFDVNTELVLFPKPEERVQIPDRIVLDEIVGRLGDELSRQLTHHLKELIPENYPWFEYDDIEVEKELKHELEPAVKK